MRQQKEGEEEAEEEMLGTRVMEGGLCVCFDGTGRDTENRFTICFTICLCMSPDFDESGAAKRNFEPPQDPQRDAEPKCFAISILGEESNSSY